MIPSAGGVGWVMNDEIGAGIVIGSVGRDLSLQAGGDIVASNKTIINNII